MQAHQGTTFYSWQPHDMVEIQVVSALSHAWAEVSYDMLYKGLSYGPPPTAEEYRILDTLNGLIVSGDALMEQYGDLVSRRTTLRWTSFEQFDLFLQRTELLQSEVR
jgi:ppGpp synthetase/RelA/SpoT-type nucleotidyltranferase